MFWDQFGNDSVHTCHSNTHGIRAVDQCRFKRLETFIFKPHAWDFRPSLHAERHLEGYILHRPPMGVSLASFLLLDLPFHFGHFIWIIFSPSSIKFYALSEPGLLSITSSLLVQHPKCYALLLSLWRTLLSGATWQHICCSSMAWWLDSFSHVFSIETIHMKTGFRAVL